MNRKAFSPHDKKGSASDNRSRPASVLIAESEAETRDAILGSLQSKGYDLRTNMNGEEALSEIKREHFDIVIAGIHSDGMDGVEFLKRIKLVSPETEVIITTTRDMMTRAYEAIDKGAYDYLVKPFEREEPLLAVQRALEKKHLIQKIAHLEEDRRNSNPLDSIVWKSASMSELIRTLQQVARLDSPVLIDGENGTGKELFARSLHNLSPRRNEPFVIFSCGAIPRDLQEGELFGRPNGNAAGRQPEHKGLFEEASGGTVYLDEVGELAPPAQAAVLQLLHNGEVKNTGTTQSRALDVRVIAATREDLERCVVEEHFREDLYYRLSVIPIHIPPLRERTEDIPLLTQWFVGLASERMGMTSPPSISPRVMNSFVSQPWRGNVQELECAVERAVALDRDGIIGMDDLPVGDSQRSEDKVLQIARKKALTLSDLEREYILEVLAECEGSRKKTAERLGITTATLWRKLKQYETRSTNNS
jgi:DNA-binding NtrC family response regulator